MNQMSNIELDSRIDAFLTRKSEKYPELRAREAAITDIKDSRSMTERLRETFIVSRPAVLR